MDFIVRFGNVINQIMGIFGTSVVVPLIVLIISAVMGVKIGKAVRGALYMAVGLTLFNAVLGILLGSIAPYITAMATDIGIRLPFVDVGWQGASVIVYSNTIGYMYLVLGLGVDLLMFSLKLTDTFHPTDIWNYYQFVFWAVIVQFVSGSLILGLCAAVLMNLVILLIADIIAPSLSEFNGYEHVTLTSCPSGGAPFAIIVAWILRKLKVKKSTFDGSAIAQKFGFWGEPLFIGLVVGVLITIFGSFSQLGSVTTWSGILTTALTVAGVMVIYPTVSGLFVKGLIPLSQSMNTRVRRSGKSRVFNIAMDPAIFFGNKNNLTAAMIMIPMVFFISLILPGNQILLLADIPALPFMTAALICVFKGDVLTTIISGTVWFSIANILNSEVCAAFTEAAKVGGVAAQVPAIADAFSQGLGVAVFTVGSNPFLWMIYKAFSLEGVWRVVGIATCILIYLAVLIHFRKNRKRWWMAAGASADYLAAEGYLTGVAD